MKWYQILKALTLTVLGDDGEPVDKSFEAGTKVELDATDQIKSLVAAGMLEETDAPDEDFDAEAFAGAINDAVDKAFATKMTEFADQFKKSTNERLSGSEVVVGDAVLAKKRLGSFKSVGHFFDEVRRVSAKGATPSDAMAKYQEVTDGIVGKEGQSGAPGDEGGIFIPSQISNEIFSKVFEQSPFFANTRKYALTGRQLKIPARTEDSRANGSRNAGVSFTWLGEGAQASEQKLNDGEVISLNLHKAMVLCSMTEELLEDSSVAERWLRDTVVDEFEFQIGEAIFNGDGNSKPQGILGASCFISTAADGSNRSSGTRIGTADEYYAMQERLYPPSRARAQWFVHNEALRPMRRTYDIGDDGTQVGNWPLPMFNFNNGGAMTFDGIPLNVAEQCKALDTLGDIVLADMSQYAIATKRTAGAQPVVDTDLSMHLWFDYDKTAYRFRLRIDGQPLWPAALTPYNGTKTTSPFVGLIAST